MFVANARKVIGGVLGALGCLAVFAMAAGAEPAAPRFNRQAWIEDYQQLKLGLERHYAHLAWFASPEGGVDLPALDRSTMRALRRASSDAAARAAVLSFVASLHDGHLTLAAAPEAASTAAEPPSAEPRDARTACAALGYAPRTAIQFSLPFESLAGFTLSADGLSEPFRSGVLDLGGAQLGIVRIPRFRTREYPALCLLAVDQTIARGAPLTAEAIADTIDATFLQVLAARLSQLRLARVNALVIDVGGNGGGNDLGDWAVRLFSAAPVRSAPLLVSSGPAGIAYLDEQIENLHATLETELPAATRAALLLRAFARRWRRRGRRDHA